MKRPTSKPSKQVQKAVRNVTKTPTTSKPVRIYKKGKTKNA